MTRLRAASVVAALACAATLLAGCAGDSPTVVAAPSPTATVSAEHQRTLQIYTAVIRELVTVDHTFGSGPSPFKHVWVLDHAVPGVASPMLEQDALGGEPFSDALRSDLKRALADLPPLDFISEFDDAGDIHADPPVRKNGVIVTVGPIEERGSKVHVGHEIWCGGLCAEWFTYVLEPRNGSWVITGDTGERAIA